MNGHNGSSDGEPSTVRFTPEHTTFIVLAILIIVFNSAVLLAMWKKKALQKPENVLLGSLAVSDLCVGLVGLPLIFGCTFTTTSRCAICTASVLFFKFISISTILHILGIITERYLQVIYPFVHRRIIARNNRVKAGIIGLWLVSLTFANMPWFWWNVNCNEGQGLQYHGSRYEIVCFALFFVVPLLLITFFLGNICLAARRYFRQNSKRCDLSQTITTPRTEVRITAVLLGMFLLFLLCWFPFFYLSIADGLELHLPFPMWLFRAMHVLRCLTSTFNPLIYTFYKEDFYQAFKMEARKLLCCCKKTRHDEARNSPPYNTPLVVCDNSTNEEMISTLKADKAQSVI